MASSILRRLCQLSSERIASPPAMRTARRAALSSSSASAADELRVEYPHGKQAGIVVIGMHRPERRNALGRNLVHRFVDAVDEVHRDAPHLRALIVRSFAPDIFCSGADLKERQQMREEEVGPFVSRLRALTRGIFDLPIPVIAAVDGGAYGGGFEIALACDLRVASEGAQLGLLETRLAIIPGAGGTQFLRRIVGASIAKDLIFSGRIVKADEALRLGLVNRLAPSGDAYEHALTLAEQISANGPVAVRMAKRAIDHGVDSANLDEALAVEAECYAHVIPTNDRTEGLSSFLEKRKPHYRGE